MYQSTEEEEFDDNKEVIRFVNRRGTELLFNNDQSTIVSAISWREQINLPFYQMLKIIIAAPMRFSTRMNYTLKNLITNPVMSHE
jgi:hypothetical protein